MYADVLWAWSTFHLADGTNASVPHIGDMLRRGHHIRCFAGKATERFLILPHRGAEFVDLEGERHMVNDWIRGACSYGLMPANGLVYNTPDPCSYYIGPGRLMVYDGADGRLLAEYDLPACPVFDGMSAADGRLLISLIDGRLLCLRPAADLRSTPNGRGEEQ